MNFLKLIKSESYKRGTMLSVLFNIISKGILFLLTIIIARFFGSNIKTDIYFFVFAAMVLFSGLINNMDTAVLIPESMRLRVKEGDAQAAAFLNFFLLVYCIIGIGFTVLMYFFGESLFAGISKFSDNDIHIYRNYFWLGSLFFIFMLLTNLVNSILTSLKYFTIPMLISSINSIIVITAIFLFKANYSVLSIFIGGLIAYAINLIILVVILKTIVGWHFNMGSSEISKKVWRNILFAGLGQVTTVASSMLPLYLLSGFGSGIISVMNYGKNIADIPNSLVTSQFANVSGIKLNEQVALQDYAGMNETFLRTTKLMVFILVPMGFYLFVFAEPVAALFYQSSNFTTDAISASAMFLKLLAVTIFSIGINAMVSRVFIAVQAIRQAFLYQLFLNVLLIASIWICTIHYGAYGYPYGIILINLVNYFLMYFICRKLVPQIDYVALLSYTALILIINIAIATGLYFTANYFHATNWVKVIFGFLLYLIILLLLNKNFKLNKDLAQILKHAKQTYF